MPTQLVSTTHHTQRISSRQFLILRLPSIQRHLPLHQALPQTRPSLLFHQYQSTHTPLTWITAINQSHIQSYNLLQMPLPTSSPLILSNQYDPAAAQVLLRLTHPSVVH